MRNILKVFHWERKGGVKYVIKRNYIYVKQRGFLLSAFFLFSYDTLKHPKTIFCIFSFLQQLVPNGRHRGCHKTIFIFVKIFKKYFFCFYIYISTPTAGVFLSSNIYLWKDIQKVFLVFLLFYISTHQRLVFFRPTAVTEAATKQYNWLALAIHHGLSSGSSKLYFSFSANHISRYNSILEYSNIFCDFLVNSIIV